MNGQSDSSQRLRNDRVVFLIRFNKRQRGIFVSFFVSGKHALLSEISDIDRFLRAERQILHPPTRGGAVCSEGGKPSLHADIVFFEVAKIDPPRPALLLSLVKGLDRHQMY